MSASVIVYEGSSPFGIITEMDVVTAPACEHDQVAWRGAALAPQHRDGIHAVICETGCGCVARGLHLQGFACGHCVAVSRGKAS